MARHDIKQLFNMASRLTVPVLTRPLGCMPASIKAVGRRDGKESDISPILADETHCFDRLLRDASLIADDHFGIETRLAQPIGAIDHPSVKRFSSPALRLLERACRQAQIDGTARFV